MKSRRGHRSGVTNRAAVPGISGLAALALALVPHHAATSPHTAGITSAGTDETPAAVDTYRVRALIAAERHKADAALPLYRVKSGDTMSGVAVEKCDGHANDWTDIYKASRAEHLTGRNANEIQIGQELAISCGYDASQLKYAPAPPPPAATTVEQARVVTRGNAITVRHHRRSEGSTVVEQARSSGSSFGNVDPHSYSGFQECVIERESGGNSQIMNSSGHYGLYQFSKGTWEAYGGSSADFGHASASEQTRVFDNAMAQGGESNWSPYDGC
jgi:hypothetical protein